jgi:hypothetical protein
MGVGQPVNKEEAVLVAGRSFHYSLRYANRHASVARALWHERYVSDDITTFRTAVVIQQSL